MGTKRNLFIVVLVVSCLGLLAVGIWAATDGVRNNRKDISSVVDVDKPNTIAPLDTPVFKPMSPEPTPVPTSVPAVTLPNTNKIDPTKPMVAFTFDDGPASQTTTQILDVVERYGVRVTFFVVGEMAQKHPDLIERAHKLGCQVGNHSQDHLLKFKGAAADAVRAELAPVDKFIKEHTGSIAPFVRPPWGTFDDTALDAMARPVVLWSVDTLDWESKDKDKVCEKITSDIFDGAIILMHDLYLTSAQAFEEMVPKLMDQGYQIVTVSEMFAARGIKLEAEHAYRSAKPQTPSTTTAP